MRTQVIILNFWLILVCVFSWNSRSHAAELTLATAPIFLGTSIDPNVFFEVDDSGSMDWETLVSEYDYYSAYWANNYENKVISGRWRSYASVGGHNAGYRKDYIYLYNESDNLYNTASYVANAEVNPESLQRDWRARSSDFNLLYYNPETTYKPWAGMTDASFYSARSDPQPGSDGYYNVRNLSGFTFEIWEDDHGYAGSKPDGPSDATDTPNGLVDLWDSRMSYTIWGGNWQTNTFDTLPAAGMAALNTNCSLASTQSWNAYSGWKAPYFDCYGTTSTYAYHVPSDINPWGRSIAQEQQNIANWYQYYRKRSYIAKAAISEVIKSSPDFRYGLSVLNDYNLLFVEVPPEGTVDYSSHNNALMQSLYSFDWPGKGTPLRKGLELAGKYYDGALSGKTDPIISECQQNFSILITDGYWNGGDPEYVIGDADGDGQYRTVADVAQYYYDKDLSSLPNKVATSITDGNDQQHMVTFTVAFGVKGNLVDTDNDGYPNPVLTESGNWGAPGSSNQAKIDDLWHAAFNSKGVYIFAQTPEEVVSSLNEALSEITDRVGSSAAVAANSGSLRAGSYLFQARFDSGTWRGELLAYTLNADGSIDSVPSWNASTVLDTKSYDTGRAILTYNPEIDVIPGGDAEGAGIPFRFPVNYISPNISSELSSMQISSLLSEGPFPGSSNAGQIAVNQQYGEKLLAYLRGDRTNESVSPYNFRTRTSAMGDVVDSDPQYVSAPRERYPEDIEDKSYLSFRTAYLSRDKMVYVGANDGMLHGFDVESGAEKIAYIPNEVFPNLSKLADDGYLHRYFVNEAPVIVDAYLNDTYNPVTSDNGLWRTVLIGGLGGGGQSVYALDITDPDDFSEANASKVVLWEFDDSVDADMGYSFGSPSIAKMANGEWVAVFGNGYNNTVSDGDSSSTGHAVLYIVDLDDGHLIKKIDTGVGSVGTPNGLSSPALIDVNDDYVVDIIYAGDLDGNMWRFDVSSSSPDDWDVAYSESGTPKPLFSSGEAITTRPQVTKHPGNYPGYMVFFGTGKFLGVEDNNSAGENTQSFYGILDKGDVNPPSISRSNLLEQTIDNQFSLGIDTDNDTVDDLFKNVRSVSDNSINYSTHKGWYMDLKPVLVEGSANTANFGEKQVSDAIIRDGRVIFSTLIPSQDPCDYGGNSYIMELNYSNGGKLHTPPFDVNNDGIVDENDAAVDGIDSGVGITPTVSIIVDISEGNEYLYSSGSTGDVGIQKGSPPISSLGRQSWRQLK